LQLPRYAVLQRDKPLAIHGRTHPGSEMGVVFDGKTMTTIADRKGLLTDLREMQNGRPADNGD
jgi:hypothetical protein